MGFFDKIKAGLKKTRDSITGQINSMLHAFTKIDEELFEELEELLVMADVGMNTATEICDTLRARVKERGITDPNEIMTLLQEVVTEMVSGDNELHLDTQPSVILVIGVNGVGKTTTIGKLASRLKKEGKSVILGAADTFRAAAIEQLEVWADRADVPIIKHAEGADPAAVVYDTISAAKARHADVVICDTAGRLHNKKNLMDELSKISRIIDRELPGCDRETLLVLDAATGQNAVNQAREFQSAAGITGIVLTKLDGTPKGGVVLPIKQDLGLPVKFIGVGEQVDDLQPFDAVSFAAALFDIEKDDGGSILEQDDGVEPEPWEEEQPLPETEEEAEAFETAEVEQEGLEPEAEEPGQAAAEEEVRPEKKKKRFWPFGRKKDESGEESE